MEGSGHGSRSLTIIIQSECVPHFLFLVQTAEDIFACKDILRRWWLERCSSLFWSSRKLLLLWAKRGLRIVEEICCV